MYVFLFLICWIVVFELFCGFDVFRFTQWQTAYSHSKKIENIKRINKFHISWPNYTDCILALSVSVIAYWLKRVQFVFNSVAKMSQFVYAKSDVVVNANVNIVNNTDVSVNFSALFVCYFVCFVFFSICLLVCCQTKDRDFLSSQLCCSLWFLCRCVKEKTSGK